jgi:hypothetical protein
MASRHSLRSLRQEGVIDIRGFEPGAHTRYVHLREQSGGNARTAGARIYAAYPSDHAFRASPIEG